MEERQWISREEEPSYSGTDLCLLILFLKEEEEKYEKAEKRQGTVAAGITSCLRRAQATWTFQKSLRGEGATCIFTEEPAEAPRTKGQIPGTHTGLSRICSRAAEGKDSGARAGRSHGAQPAALAAGPGGTLPATAASASASHNPRSTEQPQAAWLGHCTGEPARLFGHLLLVFQNLCQEKMLFLYFCKHLA